MSVSGWTMAKEAKQRQRYIKGLKGIETVRDAVGGTYVNDNIKY